MLCNKLAIGLVTSMFSLGQQTNLVYTMITIIDYPGLRNDSISSSITSSVFCLISPAALYNRTTELLAVRFFSVNPKVMVRNLNKLIQLLSNIQRE